MRYRPYLQRVRSTVRKFSRTVVVTHQSFRPESRTVNVLLGPPVTVNVSLQIAQNRSEITVSSEAPLVQAENGDVSAVF